MALTVNVIYQLIISIGEKNSKARLIFCRRHQMNGILKINKGTARCSGD
jgi:hypothetical protein